MEITKMIIELVYKKKIVQDKIILLLEQNKRIESNNY